MKIKYFAWIKDITKKDYEIIEKEKLGIVNIIAWDSTKNIYTGASDVRVRQGKASRGN